MVDSTDESDSYLVVAADPGPLRWFYAGELDLRTVVKMVDFSRMTAVSHS